MSSKPHRRASFTDMVRAVRQQPVVGEPQPGGVTDPDGTRWRPRSSRIGEAQSAGRTS